MVLKSDIDFFCLPLSIAFRRFGRAIAEIIPMIATTMSSSINVKPLGVSSRVLRTLNIGAFPLTASKGQGRCQTPRRALRGRNCPHNIMMNPARARIERDLRVPKSGGPRRRLPFRVRSSGAEPPRGLHRGSLPLKLRALRALARGRAGTTIDSGADVAQW